MDRRRFCKIAAMAAGAFGLSRFEAICAPAGSPVMSVRGDRMPADCRISVIRRECYEDLQSMYMDDPETGRCSVFTTGEVIEVKCGDKCPAGFCPQAWHTICVCMDRKIHCADNHGDGVMVTACPDGTRPVIFKVESKFNG